MAKHRRSEIRNTLEFAGPEVVIYMVLELEHQIDRNRRALQRADESLRKLALKHRHASARAAAAEARCGQIPTWTRLAEDLAAATTEAECWDLQARARSILAASPSAGSKEE